MNSGTTAPVVGLRRHVVGPDLVGAGVELVGAKATSLVALMRDGLPVPPFLCVTTAVHDALVLALPPEDLTALSDLPQDNVALSALGARVRASVREARLPQEDVDSLLAAFDGAFSPGTLVSVRSSAAGEDSVRRSFAGQFDTYLGVTRDTVSERVVECMASAFSDRALLYRRVHGLGLEATRMAVVVQEMIDSVAAGVAFTADPSSGRADRAVLSAGLGLGSGIVDGQVAVDTYVLEEDGTFAERRIVPKPTRVVLDRDGVDGVALAQTAAAEAAAPAVSDKIARRIVEMARDLAVRCREPQDVEWAVDRDGTVHLLQARPITTLPTGRSQVFDNANLVESYPGLTSPLTFSLMRRAYERNFLGLVDAFGAPEELTRRNADVYANLVGLIEGRMYYNLSNWYRMFTQIPGMERALPSFEKAMGFVSGDVVPARVGRLRALRLQVRVGGRLLAAWASRGRRIDDYRTAYELHASELRRVDVDALGPEDLADWLERCTDDLFDKMSAAPISDFFTQQLFGLLGMLIDRWELGDPTTTRNELLCGETGMESVEPVHSLVRLAEEIRADAHARTLFESSAPPTEVLGRIRREPVLAAVNARLSEHVERYGDRSLGELKLETITLADDPTALVAILRNYLRGGKNVDGMVSHELVIRKVGERKVRRKLGRNPLRRALFSFVLAQCRGGIKARESIRLTRGRQAGLFRRLVRELGDRFVEQGLLDVREDVFYLTESEVLDAVRGGAVTADLRELVRLRRTEYERYAERVLPSRIEIRGAVLAAPLPAEPVEAACSEGVLTGTGVSPGRVRARAVVVHEARADLELDGEILIASTTDPGWVFLMVAAGGLVSEQGNMLSHTAIIGRELGIPTVVGVKDAMTLVGDGMVVELDGRAGTVKLEEGS